MNFIPIKQSLLIDEELIKQILEVVAFFKKCSESDRAKSGK